MKHQNRYRTIQGNTLITGLLVILLTAVLSIGGLKDALLEAHIARNYRQHDLMFQQTESALRYAETFLIPAKSDNDISLVGSESTQRHTIPFNPFATDTSYPGSFTPSTVRISSINIPGSKVRGKGRQNRRASRYFYRIDATTLADFGGQGTQLRSIIARGTQ